MACNWHSHLFCLSPQVERYYVAALSERCAEEKRWQQREINYAKFYGSMFYVFASPVRWLPLRLRMWQLEMKFRLRRPAAVVFAITA